ncbi:MAG: carbon storage regulator CsrA [Synergistaceae bacterium]|nr:carbon storage regulator CsrA [Synergistaceae bacterium]
MLVLSRRISESIQIGTDIEVMVIDVRGDIVRIGINAPQSTQIWRKELWDVIVQENRTAAEGTTIPELTATTALPLSTFSKLSKIPTVHVNNQETKN